MLQNLVDRYKSDSRMLVILNGSSMTQMREEFFVNNRSLYGRKTCQIKLRPFGFLRCASILIRQSQLPCRICTRYMEVFPRTSRDTGNITRYLDNLVFLDLVRRETPSYTGERRRAPYCIEDNMFRFWYRFIPRSMSLINAGKPELAWSTIERNLEQFMGAAFEQICREYLWRVNGSDLLPWTFSDAGRWWGADPASRQEAEIDILAHDAVSRALFCECKWSSAKVGEDILNSLRRKSEMPCFSKLTQRHLVLFSKRGFTVGCVRLAAEMGNVILLTLDDILGA